MQVISLSSLIEVGEEGEVQDYLSSFSCSKNPGVEDFLKEQAVDSEKRSMARTSLIIDENNGNDIIGYFTLLNKHFTLESNVSKSLRQRIAFSKQATSMSTILIAQLGRADQYKGRVSGSEILGLALANCKKVHQIIGMRIVCVEYEPVEELINFYERNSFKFLQESTNGNYLSFLRLS